MIIKDLLKGLHVETNVDENLDIKGIAYDSRRVKDGDIFVCIKGFASDGHQYIRSAAENGAACALVQAGENYEEGILPLVICESTRVALGKVSATFFGHPEKKLELFAVTGTNGKTTTTYMLESILEKAGKSCGIIGTISYKAGNKILDASNTTPESYETFRMFREMVDGGNKACAMEVSSHALSMDRVANIEFGYAIFTNLTEDHLDFHKDFEDYYQAKKKLFYPVWGGSFINIDDEYGARMFRELKEDRIKVFSCSAKDESADFYAKVLQTADTFSDICIFRKGKEQAKFRIHIPGQFSVYNALGAFAAAVTSGIAPETVAAGLDAISGVPGRFELVKNDKGVVAIVDYAHTPDALVKVLDTANEFKKGRLICVFGCGGDRDSKKRPLMGQAAGERSEICIVTSDNPRTEDPKAILQDIIPGIEPTGCIYEVIEDRREAIRRAVEIYQEGDVILVAGKGHEDYQIIGTTKHHFDDKEVLAEVLQEK